MLPDPQARYQETLGRALERLDMRVVSVMAARLLGRATARKRLDHRVLLTGCQPAEVLPVLACAMGSMFPESELRQLVADCGQEWPEPWAERVAAVAAWPEWRSLQRLGLVPTPPGRMRYRPPVAGRAHRYRVRQGRLRPSKAETAVAAEPVGLLPWQIPEDERQEQLLATFRERAEAVRTVRPAEPVIPGVEMTPIFAACRLEVVEDRIYAREYLRRFMLAQGFASDPRVLDAWRVTTTPVWYHLAPVIGIVTRLAEWTGYPMSSVATMLYATGLEMALAILPDMARETGLDTPEALAAEGLPYLVCGPYAPKELTDRVHWQLRLERWRKGQPKQANLTWARLGERITWKVPRPVARAVTRTAKVLDLTTPAVSNLYLDIGLYLYTHRLILYPAPGSSARPP